MAGDIQLQKTGYRESEYERPSQKWLCGRLRDGRSCVVGPDARGRCRATAECRPVFRDGAWLCTRPPHHGGRCGEGPGPRGACARPIPPCQPMRNLRSARGIVGVWLVVATIGVLMAFGAGEAGLDFLSPGPVIYSHGDIADCGQCHSAPVGHPVAWVAAAFAPASGLADAERCLDCHEHGEHALRPHSIAPEQLTQATLRAVRTEFPDRVYEPTAATPPILTAARWIQDLSRLDWEIGCGTCHREHAGRHADLTSMDDFRCQACHLRQFASLADGHPPFLGYPYDRRTRLFFDHVSHIGKHFEETEVADAPTACTDCHTLGPGGALMLVRPFERSCADCHARDIAGAGRAGPKGLSVFEVPGLDAGALAAAGRSVGEWPRRAEGEFTPFMRLLLASDPESREVLARLEGVDLYDLSDAEDGVLDDAEQIGWAVKETLHDLVAHGHPALERRLSAALGDDVVMARRALLVGLMPVDALLAAQRDWFPDLPREIAMHRAGVPLESPTPEPAPPPDGDRMALPEGGSVEGAPPAGGDLLGGSLLGDPETGTPSPPEDAQEEEATAIGGDLLGGGGLLDATPDDGVDEPGDLLSGDLLAPTPQSEADGDLLGGDLLSADAASAPDSGPGAPSPEPEVEVPAVDREAWMAAGGWYVDHLTLRYRPSGHEDAFLRAWLDLAADPGSGPGRAEAAELFETIADPRAPGACIRCHTVDAEYREDGTRTGRHAVNWNSGRSANAAGFTRYAHAPHFSLLDERGCLTCHEVDSGAPYADAFEGRDPRRFASNFHPIEKEVCAACHTEDQAGARCTDCHDYHVGNFPPALAAAPLVLRGQSE